MTRNDLITFVQAGETAEFYNSWAWRCKSKQIIRRDRGECQRCKRRGRYAKAVCVHHKKELKDYPSLAFDDDNLEALCGRCHNELHDKQFRATESRRAIITEERW